MPISMLFWAIYMKQCCPFPLSLTTVNAPTNQVCSPNTFTNKIWQQRKIPNYPCLAKFFFFLFSPWRCWKTVAILPNPRRPPVCSTAQGQHALSMSSVSGCQVPKQWDQKISWLRPLLCSPDRRPDLSSEPLALFFWGTISSSSFTISTPCAALAKRQDAENNKVENNKLEEDERKEKT